MPEETYEEFEQRRTRELNETIAPGSYLLDGGPGHIKLHTGKGGYIQYLVALEWACRNYKLT